ncbi:hypothetical protein LZ31DRAFT_240688 [Colletotrichum somersetense]|nr:hypothetical protein LZ31DRAFT_240688 [Colletotrichum somersetense]
MPSAIPFPFTSVLFRPPLTASEAAPLSVDTRPILTDRGPSQDRMKTKGEANGGTEQASYGTPKSLLIYQTIQSLGPTAFGAQRTRMRSCIRRESLVWPILARVERAESVWLCSKNGTGEAGMVHRQGKRPYRGSYCGLLSQ